MLWSQFCNYRISHHKTVNLIWMLTAHCNEVKWKNFDASCRGDSVQTRRSSHFETCVLYNSSLASLIGQTYLIGKSFRFLISKTRSETWNIMFSFTMQWLAVIQSRQCSVRWETSPQHFETQRRNRMRWTCTSLEPQTIEAFQQQ